MSDHSNKKILIIANARYKGGLSGGDAIYENFKKHWKDCTIVDWDLRDLDYKPFFVCYIHRIIHGCVRAILCNGRFDVVYSASDFLADSMPAFIFKIKGNKWVAGFFLEAFRGNRFHYFSQKLVRRIIEKYADMVIVTNPTMYKIFPNKKKTWINGGIDMSLAGRLDDPKIYDAVFCGRLHPSKGIDELIDIWELVRRKKHDATLALIGDGDLGLQYVKRKIQAKFGFQKWGGITLAGYVGDERFKIYKQSKVVLYPTPIKYDHFSMAPVEAMACGCPILHFRTPVLKEINPEGNGSADSIQEFADNILYMAEEISDIGYVNISTLAFGWARQYDYKIQALRVQEEITKGLS